jgi:hypothetical protein
LSLANQFIVFGPLLCPRVELRLRHLAASGSGLGRCLCHRWH